MKIASILTFGLASLAAAKPIIYDHAKDRNGLSKEDSSDGAGEKQRNTDQNGEHRQTTLLSSEPTQKSHFSGQGSCTSAFPSQSWSKWTNMTATHHPNPPSPTSKNHNSWRRSGIEREAKMDNARNRTEHLEGREGPGEENKEQQAAWRPHAISPNATATYATSFVSAYATSAKSETASIARESVFPSTTSTTASSSNTATPASAHTIVSAIATDIQHLLQDIHQDLEELFADAGEDWNSIFGSSGFPFAKREKVEEKGLEVLRARTVDMHNVDSAISTLVTHVAGHLVSLANGTNVSAADCFSVALHTYNE